MTRIENVLYTANVHVTGGRDGQAQSNDDRLNLKLSPPGSSGRGTNPEQLFAAGWSACFIGAMGRQTWHWIRKWTWAPPTMRTSCRPA